MRRPPLAFLGGEERFTEKDNKLLLAHKFYEAERCSCGFRRSVCSVKPDRHQWFEVEDDSYCYVEEAIEDFKSAEGYEPQPGQRLTVVIQKASGALAGASKD